MGTHSFKHYKITDENKDEILNLLRNQEFLLQINAKDLEKIINQLDFKSLFNIIQNNIILDKISSINTNILEKDSFFFPNFLDSVTLVKKSNSHMIYDMLNYLSNDAILYYLVCPYIRAKLSDVELVELLYKKEIPFNDILENEDLFNAIPFNLLTNYINRLWLQNPNSKIINKKVIKKLFDINDEILDSINLEEVNYLFETIKTKNLLSIQETKITISSYKALLSSYLVFGINKTLEIINNGNKGINANMINVLQKEIIDYKLTEFYSQNFNILHNITENILSNLKLIKSKDEKNFKEKIAENSYLSSIINFIIDYNYMTIDNITKFLYNINLQVDDILKQKELSNFCNNCVNHILKKIEKEIKSNTIENSLKHFELKKKPREKEYRKISTISLQRISLKLFVEALKGNIYSYAFKNENTTSFLTSYRNFIKKTGFEENYFIENILVPLSNGNFEITSFLEKLGINKPYSYNLYIDTQKKKENISEINSYLKELKKKYNPDTLLEIINYILYGTKINNKIHKKDLEVIKEIQINISEILENFTFDKENLEINLESSCVIPNDYELLKFMAAKERIEKIIKKTINYLNRHMNKKAIKEKHFKEFLDLTCNSLATLPFNDINYTLIVRTFTFTDLERIFEGFDIKEKFVQDIDLEKWLLNNQLIVLTAEGYLKDTINLGFIISNWHSIRNICQGLNIDIKELNIFDCYKILQENTFKLDNFDSTKNCKKH